MTIDRWIALGACIAAFFSAIAACLVVWQSSLQRKLAYKPQIILKPLSFKYQISTVKTDIFNKIIFLDTDNTIPHKTDCLVNIGLGTAVDLSINWEYDSKKLATLLNEAFNKEAKGKKLTVYNNAISLDVPTNDFDRYSYSRENNSDKIDYVLPYNQIKNPVHVIIPHTYFSLNCALLIYSLKFLSTMQKSTSIITLHIKYLDIGGVQYNHEYEVKTSYHYSQCDGGNTTMFGQITFTKKHHRLTMTGLTKIRKSYADFMNEHDFNKNR
jgi:hypothetical protein